MSLAIAKKLYATFITGEGTEISVSLRSAPWSRSRKVDAVDITTLDKTRKRFAAGSLTRYDELTFTILGPAPAQLKADGSNLNISLRAEGGEEEIEAWIPCTITGIKPSQVEASGERLITTDIVVRVLRDMGG